MLVATVRVMRRNKAMLPPAPNAHESPMTRARTTKQWRSAASAACLGAGIRPHIREGAMCVTLTRQRTRGPGLDEASLPASLKAVQDGVADMLWNDCQSCVVVPCGHRHDNDDTVTWRFRQQQGSEPCVIVEVIWICPGCHSEVDYDTCGCGGSREGHGVPMATGHVFVPMGCRCLVVASGAS